MSEKIKLGMGIGMFIVAFLLVLLEGIMSVHGADQQTISIIQTATVSSIIVGMASMAAATFDDSSNIISNQNSEQ